MSATSVRLSLWKNEASRRAAAAETEAAKLAHEAEQLKQKSERARQRALVEHQRANELAKHLESPSNATERLVIAPPNDEERRDLFSKYAGTIAPAPPANAQSAGSSKPAKVQTGGGGTQSLTEEQKQSLFRKYAALVPPPNAAQREAQRALMDRVRAFHAQSASEFGGFSAPSLWSSQLEQLEQREQRM